MIQKLLDLIHGYPILGSAGRSSEWSSVQKAFLKEHPTCAVCGKKNSLLNPLNIHHKTPFHIDPSLELSPGNLITLCRPHHLLFGHLMLWSSWNISVEEDAKLWYNLIQNRPLHEGKVAN